MLKGWRTIVVFGLSALAYLLGWDNITQVIPPEWLAVGTSIVGIALRLITNTPVGTKPDTNVPVK